MFLVIVGLQDVSVLGHHEDGDEVNNSKSQKLSLLTVLLKQITYTKRPAAVRLPQRTQAVTSELWRVLCSACTAAAFFFFVVRRPTHDISEDDSPEAVNVHVLKKPVQVTDWRHSTSHCVHWTLHVIKQSK